MSRASISLSGYLHNETSKTYLAGIAAINSGAIVSCHNGADLYGESYIGGIAATGTGVIVKCSNSGTIRFAGKAAQGEYFGGICATPQYIIANCYNTGAIRVSALERKEVYAGGIAGSFEAKSAASTADLRLRSQRQCRIQYDFDERWPDFRRAQQGDAAGQLLPEDGLHQQRLQ